MQSRSIYRNILYAFIILIITGAFLYGLFITFACSMAYSAMKQKSRGWYGRVHRLDEALGFAPIPGAEGMHIFPIGPDLPMRYGKEGFRVPMDEDLDLTKRPLFLFLGCSYTYGDACRAEEVFAYLVGKHFNGEAINAGVCGYGLSQMRILAERLIPRYRPDFVIVQYSDWLVNRATREFSPTYFFNIPYPYFTDSPAGYTIEPPVYRTTAFEQDISTFRMTPGGIADYLKFSRIALPLKVREDFQYLLFLAKKACGMTPVPAQDKQKVVDFFYRTVRELCEQNGAHMIVIGIREQDYRPDSSFVYVDADTALRDGLQPGEEYAKKYSHWRGDPPVKVDNHPNPLAHRIIAAGLIDAINGLLPKK